MYLPPNKPHSNCRKEADHAQDTHTSYPRFALTAAGPCSGGSDLQLRRRNPNMKTQYPWRWAVVLAALALAFAGTAIAQVGTGNLYGTIVDEQGAPLPGVTVELSGQGAPQVQV